MKDSTKSVPTIWIYRTKDSQQYLFLEFAAVDEGRYVAWGDLRTMSRGEVAVAGLTFVLESLNMFSSRDGNDKSKRLKFLGQRIQADKYESVSVRLLPTSLLEIIPQNQRDSQYDRLDEQRITFDPAVQRDDFVSALDRAFGRLQAPGQAAPRAEQPPRTDAK